MHGTPPVSICIPVHNGERFLAETIRSTLDQSHTDFELVILDNASTDATARIARSFGDPRIRLVTNPATLAQPDNWRAAVRLCRGPLIKLLCADDLLHPRCLEYQVGAMRADPRIALVTARRHMVDENGRILVPNRGLTGLTGVRSGAEVARRVVRSGANPLGEPGGALFRRAHYDAVGGWRPERRHAMDLDLWVRLLQHGEFLGLPETLAAFRVARQSLSADNEAGVYAHQKAIMADLAAAEDLQVRPLDSRIGQVLAPTGRLRRRILFGMSRRRPAGPATPGRPAPADPTSLAVVAEPAEQRCQLLHVLEQLAANLQMPGQTRRSTAGHGPQPVIRPARSRFRWQQAVQIPCQAGLAR